MGEQLHSAETVTKMQQLRKQPKTCKSSTPLLSSALTNSVRKEQSPLHHQALLPTVLTFSPHSLLWQAKNDYAHPWRSFL